MTRLTGVKVPFSVLGLLLLFSSCKTNKQLHKVTPRTAIEVLAGLNSRTIDYDLFSAKARIKFNGVDAQIGGRSRIIMIKDSLIWMNFKKLSIEGARALIRPDSTWILYRFDDLYEAGPTQEFLDYYKIYRSYGGLQEMLIGNFPIPDLSDINEFSHDFYYKMTFDTEGEVYEYQINEDLSIFRVLINDTTGRQIRITFSDYDDHHFATRKEIEVYTPQDGHSKITVKLSSVEFNVPKEIKFEIPSHYTHLP